MALNQLTDRCDATTTVIDNWESPVKNSCRAEALVRVESVKAKVVLELMFCFHHFAKNEQALYAQGWVVTDNNRSKLMTKAEALVGSEH